VEVLEGMLILIAAVLLTLATAQIAVLVLLAVIARREFPKRSQAREIIMATARTEEEFIRSMEDPAPPLVEPEPAEDETDPYKPGIYSPSDEDHLERMEREAAMLQQKRS